MNIILISSLVIVLLAIVIMLFVWRRNSVEELSLSNITSFKKSSGMAIDPLYAFGLQGEAGLQGEHGLKGEDGIRGEAYWNGTKWVIEK